MENRTCVDCTVFIETQGMYGHPIFQAETAWLQHRHESHGGPKPPEPKPEPQHDEPETQPAGIAPEPEPFPRYATFVEKVDERFTDLERRVYFLEEAAAKTPAPAIVLPEPTPEG